MQARGKRARSIYYQRQRGAQAALGGHAPGRTPGPRPASSHAPGGGSSLNHAPSALWLQSSPKGADPETGPNRVPEGGRISASLLADWRTRLAPPTTEAPPIPRPRLVSFSAPGSPGTGSEGADPAGGWGCGGTWVGTLAFPSGRFCVLRGVRPCVCSTARAGPAGGVVQPGWWSLGRGAAPPDALGAGARAEPRLGEGRVWVRRQCSLCSGAACRGRGRAQGAGPAGPGARLLGNRKEMQVVATGGAPSPSLRACWGMRPDSRASGGVRSSMHKRDVPFLTEGTRFSASWERGAGGTPTWVVVTPGAAARSWRKYFLLILQLVLLPPSSRPLNVRAGTYCLS